MVSSCYFCSLFILMNLRLLFQFHKQQNSKKPGSVHAIYLVTGFIIPLTPTNSGQATQADGEDAFMQSSPFMSSSMPHREDEEEPLAVKTISICREEDLEEIKAKFAGKVSIHIYSLGPSTIQNIHILSECNRAAAVKCASEDPLSAGRQYGTIQNPRVKRRTGARPLPAQTAPAASRASLDSKASTPAMKAETKPSQAPTSKALSSQAADRSETKSKDETPQQSSQQKKPATKTPALKREQSDIFKSFSKPPNKVSRENTASSAGGASPAPKVETPAAEEAPIFQEDESMDDASNGEQLEDSMISEEKAAKSKRPTRSEREDQLKKLLDDDDDGMTASTTIYIPKNKTLTATDDEPTNTTEPEANNQVQSQPTVEAPEKQAPMPSTTTSGGRRRGRRKIMKKKTIKDDEGYLGNASPQPNNLFPLLFQC
ncbi:MAG: hypothetical protein Q9209_004229 [Squamulea sp. 1 TL-2023]